MLIHNNSHIICSLYNLWFYSVNPVLTTLVCVSITGEHSEKCRYLGPCCRDYDWDGLRQEIYFEIAYMILVCQLVWKEPCQMTMLSEFIWEELLERNSYEGLNTQTLKRYWLCITINNSFPSFPFCSFQKPSHTLLQSSLSFWPHFVLLQK